jgi:hypothetical protein
MQRTVPSARSLDRPAEVPATAGAGPGPTVDVPSDQLWRDAISATRRAATAAAELRLALQASRGVDGRDRAG